MSKIKKYDEFLNEKGFVSAIGAGALAIASTLVVNKADAMNLEPVEVTDTSIMNKDKSKSLESFVDTIVKENPHLIVDEINTNEPLPINNNVESLSFIEKKVSKFNTTMISDKLPELSLSDLDLLSKPGLPFKINYFYVRGLDNQESGPFLIPILNLSYTKAIDIKGHEIKFNFTRMNGVNTFGATLNF